jgi:hypothetical protein
LGKELRYWWRYSNVKGGRARHEFISFGVVSGEVLGFPAVSGPVTLKRRQLKRKKDPGRAKQFEVRQMVGQAVER